ncbi:HNH endonuclease [Vampirovibrio chlorellavorus]|uniref:HNH endonuclease n=1 Tax=Vampirovibrio chlorellavorus TaxID=758823 RepID=UPI0026EA0DB9|nr:HNH endonuclease [Vampirovibrio chlorellavorus]
MPLSNRVCFLVNLRDALRCRQCDKVPQGPEGYHQGFEYHHRLPRSLGGSDEVDNIVLLCHACHQVGHKAPASHSERLCVLDLTPPASFLCWQCQSRLESRSVEMNCGWYRCRACQTQVHLYQHFYGALE